MPRKNVLMITCAGCQQERPFRSKGLCEACYTAQYRAAHPGKRDAADAKYRENHPEIKDRIAVWRSQNPLRCKEAGDRWRRSHPEQVRAKFARWCAKHPEAMRRHRATWRLNHPDRQQASIKSWTSRNRDRLKVYAQRRRALELGLEHTLTAKEWQTILLVSKNRCYLCDQEFTQDDPPVQEHIIPLSNRTHGTTLANIKPAHRSCNSRKGTKAVPFPVQLQLV